MPTSCQRANRAARMGHKITRNTFLWNQLRFLLPNRRVRPTGERVPESVIILVTWHPDVRKQCPS